MQPLTLSVEANDDITNYPRISDIPSSLTEQAIVY